MAEMPSTDDLETLLGVFPSSLASALRVKRMTVSLTLHQPMPLHLRTLHLLAQGLDPSSDRRLYSQVPFQESCSGFR